MSRQSISLLTLTVAATAAITALRFVGHGGAHAGAGAPALGVARTDGALGARVPVDVLGTAVVTAGGLIPAGSPIEVGANGKAVLADDGVVVGWAAPGASAAADGDPIEIVLITAAPAPSGG